MDGLRRDAAGIGALADPLRHQLYQFVCAQPASVSREQAADALGIPLHQAKFHLDRLEAEGLLESRLCAADRAVGSRRRAYHPSCTAGPVATSR